MEQELEIEIERTEVDTNPDDEPKGVWQSVDIKCGMFTVSIMRTEYEDGRIEELMDYKVDASERFIIRGDNIKRQGPWLEAAKVVYK